MTKLNKILRTAGATGALFALAGSALADGYGGSVKDAPPAPGRTFSYTVNAAVTTDYIFRGISQSSENPAVSAGFDATYGLFYAGFWGSSIDFDLADQPSAEFDVYAGIKPVLGPVTFDFGVLGYLYPGDDLPTDSNYLELKAGASITPFTNASAGVNVYYSPEFFGETGEAWAVEGNAAYTFAAIGRFTPTISGAVGWQKIDETDFDGATDDDYVYWNAGVGIGFDKFTLDLRYWDTDIDGGTFATETSADERFVATLKVVLP